MADIKDISTPDLLKSIEKFGTIQGLKYTPTDMEAIRSLGRDQIEKEYKRIMGGTKLTKKKSKPKKVVTAKRGGMIKKFASGGAAKRGYGKVIK
jgi:hypothetical protein